MFPVDPLGPVPPLTIAVWNGNHQKRNGQNALTIFHILKYWIRYPSLNHPNLS